MPANVENSAVATGLEKVSFHSNPKERQCQRMLKLSHNLALISHASKVMLNILQTRLQQYVNQELPDVQGGFRKGRGTRDQISKTTVGSLKKLESSRKASTSALLTMPKPLTVDHNKPRQILKEVGILYHLTCLLINLYASQEATVRTGHEVTDWFQIRKGVCQACNFQPVYLTYKQSTS